MFLWISCHFECPTAPKGPPGETLKSQIRVKFEVFFLIVSQGGFQGAKMTIWEVIWGWFWVSFLVWFWSGLRSGSCYSHEHGSAWCARVFNYFYALQELSLGITSPIHLQHCWCFPEDDAFAWCFQSSNYLHGSNIDYVFLSFSWAGFGHSSIPRLQTCSRDSVTNQNK